jgi:hypothetical protein
MPGRRINYGFLVFAACVATAFLFEGSAATSHADHTGDEDSCPICFIDQHIKNFPRQLKILWSHFAFPMGALLLSAFIVKQFFDYIPASSVKLKIKMTM